MVEKRYRIIDENGNTIASGMLMEMVCVFLNGYECAFWNNHLLLTIEEMEEVRKVSDSYDPV